MKRLGDDFASSSMFHEVEVALANLGLSELDGAEWDVVVGGLDSGYTAAAALENPKRMPWWWLIRSRKSSSGTYRLVPPGKSAHWRSSLPVCAR